jgi:cysteine desulfurase
MAILLNSNIVTQTSKSVIEAMEPFANMAIDLNITTKENQKALKAYKEAIDKIYRSINAKDEDTILLTSGVNEATSQLFLSMYLKYIITGRKNSVVISQRASIDEIRAARFLESQGCRVHRVPVSVDGTVDVTLLKEYVNNKTALVSVPLVDDESGVIQPIEDIALICEAAGAPLYVNAKDAFGRVGVDVQRDKVSFLSFCSDTIEGPKDVAALYVSASAPELMPTVFGSQNEQGGLRAMPKDIAKVIGFAKAAEIAVDALDFDIEDIRELRDEFEQEILKIDGAYSLAPWALRVPTVCIVAFEGVHASALLDRLASKDIAAYSFAAFSSMNFQRVSIVDIANLSSSLKHCTIGFSLGSNTTKEELDSTLEAIKEAIEEIRSFSSCKGDSNE